MTSAEVQSAITSSPASPISRLTELGEQLQRTVDNLTDLFRQENVQTHLTSSELDVLRTAAEYAHAAAGEIVFVGAAARDRAHGRSGSDGNVSPLL
jgi:hypothetical protein